MNTIIIPDIASGFPVTPYTPPDLKVLDTIILKAAKTLTEVTVICE